MDTFFLEILSPERTFYAGECSSVVLPISDGMLGIMAHHAPLAAALQDGEIIFTKPDGEKVNCVVAKGIANVTDNHVSILCKSAIRPDEIDEEAERILAEEAKLKLKAEQSRKEYLLWQLSFNQALNRLKVKNKQTGVNL